MMKNKCKGVIMKKSSSSRVELKGRRWSDLELDLLGEIKKKLYLGDHIRFGAVCKSWNAAAAPPRPGDVLPWLMLIRRGRLNSLVYKLYEPCSVPLGEATVYDKIRLDPVIYKPKSALSLLIPLFNITCGYGWMLISLLNLDATISHLMLFSPLTKKTIMLPPLIHHLAEPQKTNFDFIKTFSCNPESPHCVYLILHIIHASRRIISLLHHGDKAWTSWESAGGYFPCPSVKHGVHIRGIFYFLYASGRLGSYNISSGKLTTTAAGRGDNNNNNVLIFDNIHEFFEFKGDLMLTYYDTTNSFNYTIRRYDWSHKVWVPLQTLGDCSLFISSQTFYVEARDNGVSANKIYVLDDDTSAVYSLDNGRLFKCTSELKYWDDIYTGTFSPIWIQPQPQPQPPHHLQMRSGEFDAEEEVAQ